MEHYAQHIRDAENDRASFMTRHNRFEDALSKVQDAISRKRSNWSKSCRLSANFTATRTSHDHPHVDWIVPDAPAPVKPPPEKVVVHLRSGTLRIWGGRNWTVTLDDGAYLAVSDVLALGRLLRMAPGQARPGPCWSLRTTASTGIAGRRSWMTTARACRW